MSTSASMSETMGGLEMRSSDIHSRGVFATRAFRAGEVVERCPVLVVPAAERGLLDRTHLFNYYFNWAGEAAAIALGWGSLYNHAASPLARYRKDFDAGVVEFVAVEDIAAGREITVDYTDGGKNELWFPV
ncbi:SET domain-containing protein [Streptomyces sp. H27-D2]|uniref:SET domain-containing protein n=1 Tax=Streptomyces sp. H27-D2 TaxID=3046304 RepID=UPI002DBB1D4D|nr:SET domain-containing protein [Streptomyces sp. H27-D2]MEC4015966.1 SET domain-containing protein [Streptomyces sp. H27-D2]